MFPFDDVIMQPIWSSTLHYYTPVLATFNPRVLEMLTVMIPPAIVATIPQEVFVPPAFYTVQIDVPTTLAVVGIQISCTPGQPQHTAYDLQGKSSHSEY